MSTRIHQVGIVIVLAMVALCFSRSQSHMLRAQQPLPFVAQPKWSVDGSKVASVNGFDVDVRDAGSGSVLFTLRGHSDTVFSMNWSPDGTRIATASFDETVKVWDASDGQLVLDLVGHDDRVTLVVWSPNSQRLVSFGVERLPSMFVWDSSDGRALMSTDAGTVTDSAFSPDGSRLAVSVLSWLVVYDAAQFQVQVNAPYTDCCANQMYRLAWSPDGNQIATGSINGLVTIWDAQTLTQITQFAANPNSRPDSREVADLSLSWIRDLWWGSDGLLQIVSGDGTATLWSPATQAVVQSEQLGHLASASWSMYGGQLAIFSPVAQNTPARGATQSSIDNFNVETPFATSARLASIAAACNAPPSVTRALPAQATDAAVARFETALDALPSNAIPPACAADLQAVADALVAGN